MTGTAVVTGLTGFIGRRLTEILLSEGWEVHGIARNQSVVPDPRTGRLHFHVYDGSVDSLCTALEASRPDIVFHLATLYLAEHSAHEIETLVASNVLLPAQLAEAMTGLGCTRLVNVGTAWQHYGGTGYNPVNLYAATKQAAEDLLRYYYDARGLSVTTLKLYDTWGEGDTRRKVLQILLEAAKSGVPLDMSPGEQILDLIYVDDVVDALMLAAGRMMRAPLPEFDQFLLSGERLRLRDLAEIVGDVVGMPVPVRFGSRPYRTREVMEPVVPREDQWLPGWAPKHPLRTTLHRLAQSPA